jgi:hypothetical protein
MRWRYRNSAVANRHALRSDYYSTTKKTANPLNEWWTTTERRAARSARLLALRCVRRARERFRRAMNSRFSIDCRNACGTGVSLHDKATAIPVHAKSRRRKCVARRGDEAVRSLPRDAQKNFPPSGRSDDAPGKKRGDEGESVQVIRDA